MQTNLRIFNPAEPEMHKMYTIVCVVEAEACIIVILTSLTRVQRACYFNDTPKSELWLIATFPRVEQVADALRVTIIYYRPLRRKIMLKLDV